MEASLGDRIQAEIEGSIVSFVDFLPSLIAAVAILYIGVFVGSKLKPIVGRTARRVDLDQKVRQTPFGPLFPAGEEAVSRTFGVLVKYYVILIAVFVAAEWLSLQVLTGWIDGALSYVPALAAGLVILTVGFFIADYIADVVRRSNAAQESNFSALFAGFTKVFLYFVVTVIGLDTMGVNVAILYTFAEAFAYAAGLAAALAIGIAFGWGGKDHVAENMDNWLANSKDATQDSPTVSDD